MTNRHFPILKGETLTRNKKKKKKKEIKKKNHTKNFDPDKKFSSNISSSIKNTSKCIILQMNFLNNIIFSLRLPLVAHNIDLPRGLVVFILDWHPGGPRLKSGRRIKNIYLIIYFLFILPA